VAIPILRVTDIERALTFYTKVLGATLLWRDSEAAQPTYAAVQWREHEIHLSSHSGDGAFRSMMVIRVDDVDAVFADLVARGYVPGQDPVGDPVHAAPTDQTWGLREWYVEDPDGNTIRFAQGGG
jgi:catechol 2,3-dioxygenase-like lactoylglutathione lyase family enzyme